MRFLTSGNRTSTGNGRPISSTGKLHVWVLTDIRPLQIGGNLYLPPLRPIRPLFGKYRCAFRGVAIILGVKIECNLQIICMACNTRAKSSAHQACPKPSAQCVKHAEPHVNQCKNLFSPPPHSAEHEHLHTQLPAQGKHMLHCTWMWLGLGAAVSVTVGKCSCEDRQPIPRRQVTADGLFSDC